VQDAAFDSPVLSFLVANRDSTLGRSHGIDSRHMQRAVLYARVSSDKQRQEQTIESQVAELRRQIEAAGHVLVKEYIDDGYSGAYLDRAALLDLLAASKMDTFDAVYFLCPDRIARATIHQDIIIAELVRHKKRIFISGREHEETAENRFTLQIFGAVSEFERAKITERMMRGKLHRLRKGEFASGGIRAFGYDYRRKTETAPASLAINEPQAAVVRAMFEMYGSGNFGLCAITRSLEQQRIPTCKAARTWNVSNITRTLKNSIYVGVKYANRMTHVRDPSGNGKHTLVERDRDQWIALKVPAIVSQELFDKAQERLRLSAARYKQPRVKYLLSGLLECGECGRAYCSMRLRNKVQRASGVRVFHCAVYKCVTILNANQHDPAQRKRCRNSKVSTHIVEEKVLEMIRDVMFDPQKLGQCIDSRDVAEGRREAQQLTRIAASMNSLDDERRGLIERYVRKEIPPQDYTDASRCLDTRLERLTLAKTELVKRVQAQGLREDAEARIRRFCATARARFEGCADVDAKREFLNDQIETVIFDRGRITIVGSIPIQGNQAKLAFRIEGQIDRASIRLYASQRANEAQRQARLRMVSLQDRSTFASEPATC